MSLTNKQTQDICQVHQGHSTCRYLSFDAATRRYNCLKLTSHKKVIDDELAETITNLSSKGIDFRKQGLPVGDNCKGYPLLRIINQGYDVP